MWLMVAMISLFVTASESNYPTFDISSSTLHIFLPANTKPGNIIYRIRATDQDKDYPLVFGATDFGSYVIRLETLPCHSSNYHCAANMYLTRSVAPRQKYTFRMTVTDASGNTATKQVTLEVTDSTADIKYVFPYIPGIIRVPENFSVGQELEHVTVRKNPRLTRPALLELWKEENGSFLEKPFEFKLTQQSKKDTTTGYILLDQPLDFELKTMYKLSVYALDMYAVPGEDSRNIAGFDLVVVVEDVQDTPPVWDHIEPITRLPANVTEGLVVMKVTARDGDKGAPRPVKYGLVPEGNPFTTFFSIDQDTGEIRLVRPIKELRSISRAHQPILLTVVAEEIVNDRQNPDTTSSTATVAFLVEELQTSAPSFLSSSYVAYVEENSIQGTVLKFENQFKTQVDLGKHGVFSLELENNNGTFEITPSIGNQLINFIIRVRDNSLLDYEATKSLVFKITAKEVNTDNKSQAISNTVDVTVYITDINDNAPVFSHMKYTTKMSENVTMGTEVMRVYATDLDSMEAGVVRYTAIIGYLNTSFNLHPKTGAIVVNTNKHGFDREEKSEYNFLVEARDMDGVGNKGTVPLVFEITDVNDEVPIFTRNPMDVVLASGGKNFTEKVFLKAIDKDAEPPNNIVRYEIVSGNYNNKFAINHETGELTVKNTENSRVLRQTSDSTTEIVVRAYDLGIPTLWSTGQVRIYPAESGVSILTFIVPGDKPNKRSVEQMLTALTGGNVTLQEIYPYKGGLQEAAYDLAAGHPDSNKSVVIATVLRTETIFVTTMVNKPELIAAAENRILFWILVILLILIALALLTLLCCCLCTCCPLYAIGRRKRRVQTQETILYNTQNVEPGHESKGVQAEWSGSARKEAWSADTYTQRNWQFNRRNNVRRNEPQRVILVAAPHSENTAMNGDVHQVPPESQPGVNVIYTKDIVQRPSDRIILEDVDGTEYRVLDPSRLSRTVRREEDPDTDSMRRHEYERGSDVGGTLHEERAMENAPRDQMFIREGNAEILRLITRGRVVEEEEPKLNQPDRPYTEHKVSEEKHEDNGKVILMQRFMEDQRVSSDKQSSTKQEEQTSIKNIEVEHHKVLKQEESKEKSEDLMKTIMNIPERNLSTGDVNRLTTLQRDLLLTRFLVEEQRRSLAHVTGHDDTQSLPGMTSSMATQTDVNRGTQTDILYTMRPPRRKVKSDIEDSGGSDTEEKQENIYNKLKKSKTKIEEKLQTGERTRSLSRCEIKTPIMEETESAMEAAGEVLYNGDSILQSGFGATKSSLLRLQTTRKKLHLDDTSVEQIVPNINRSQDSYNGFVHSKHKSYSEQDLSFNSYPIGAVKDFNSSFKSLQPTPVTKRKYVKLKETPTEIDIYDSMRSKSSMSTSASSKHTEVDSGRKSRRNSVSGDAVSSRYRIQQRKKSKSQPETSKERFLTKSVQSAGLKKNIKKEFEEKRANGQLRYMEWYKSKREERERQKAVEEEERMKSMKSVKPKRNISKQQDDPKIDRKTSEFKSKNKELKGAISKTIITKQDKPQYSSLQSQTQTISSGRKSKSPSKEIKEETSQTRGLEDDMDSGIAMSHMLPGSQKLKRKNQNLMEKKSVFTIAYDDMQTKQLRLDSASPP